MPYSTVLCQFYSPLISKTLNHCLLPPPDSEAPSMTLCAQFLFSSSEAMPFFNAGTNCWLPSSDLSSSYVQQNRTTNKSWRSTFRHHVGTCVLPCSCAMAMHILSCVFLHFPQGVLVHKSFFSMRSCSARRSAHCVRVGIPLPAHQYMDDTAHDVSKRNLYFRTT